MASAVTLKDEIQHGGSANVDKGSTVAVQANSLSSKAVESYNSHRY